MAAITTLMNADRAAMLGYAGVIGGVVLAFISAVVPFFGAGYRLDGGVLIAGLSPYLVYALVVALWHAPATLAGGSFVLAVHAWLVVSERFLGDADYRQGWIYYVPFALALALAPLLVAALRRTPWYRQNAC